MLKGKHIVIGISGGIAAYKIPELIRILRKEGAEVKVTTTKNALEFVTELTLQTLSGNKVYSDVFAAINEHSTEHISLPDWADVMVVAPATANVIGKMANGIADDALTTTFCAMRKPVVIAPAMNNKMYQCPATQEAMLKLAKWDNVTMLDCAEGELACGTTGKGRMQEVDAIAEAARYALTDKDLAGKKVMITSGPTQEAIDPVRYLTNRSSGKQGASLAMSCWRRGADVIFVTGPSAVGPCFPQLFGVAQEQRKVSVTSAAEMAQKVTQNFADCDVAILCAAVADFTPSEVAKEKIKKKAGQTNCCLELVTTTDIAATLGEAKQAGQKLVGFALETCDEEHHALRKLESKHLDLIVLNSLQDKGAGFGVDTNKVTLLFADGSKKDVPLQTKEDIANAI
ncbi:MAG: bifunctional phosphopantothenoylcysteine decarboxylase/phosphopantothenate--cysteine ligase CoaBC, partial [Paludibacteraceae bacterium]|nr:bifunctional phosphopantothenoylcysteine decarboxylase/phosphopantothenate--cysteine ligase CoaBC [Paludibacteraceae bacterium]